jgi:hypothetical protein
MEQLIKTPRRLLRVIMGLSVLLRLGAALYLGDQVNPEPGIYDQISYDALAHRVSIGAGFTFERFWWPAVPPNTPTSFWSFLYTLYLAGVYVLFGHHPLAARLIQAVATGVLMPLLTYRVARRICSPIVGLVAAVISTVYVYFFYYDAALMTEAFYMAGALWVFDLALSIRESVGQHDEGAKSLVFRWVLLGIAMGASVLLRQTFFPIIGLVGVWLWYAVPGGRLQVVRGFLLSLLIVVTLILPWTIRNYHLFGQFTLLNTNAGFAFFWANHPIHGTDFIPLLGPEDPSYYQLIPPELLALNEAALEKALMREGLQFVVDDPVRYILLSISRIKDYFLFWPRAESSLLSNISRVGSFGLFLPFMIYGLVLSFKSIWPQRRGLADDIRSAGVVLLYAFIVVYTGVHLLSWAGVRYRLPVDTVLVIFAALGLYDLYTRFVHRYARRLIERFQVRRGA